MRSTPLRRRTRSTAVALPLLLAMLLLLLPPLGMLAPIGCAPAKGAGAPGPKGSQIPDPPADAPGKPTAAITNTDPCAERLHHLCGPLLLYYSLNRRVPDRIEELREIAGPDPLVDFTCPVSGRPYVYAPQGVRRGNGQPGILVLFDAAPTHSGMRWAVSVEPGGRPNEPIVTKVVAEPETTFHPRE